MKEILSFITANQNLIIVFLVVGAFCFKTLVEYMAHKNPKIDGWDKIEPYSNKAYDIIHKGIEHWGTALNKSSLEKADEYIKKLKQFEADWNGDRLKAISNLIGWYLSMKQKVEKISANPLTADTKAIE